MSAQPKTFYTSEEYLERELRADFKSEYVNGEILAMSGAMPPHNVIAGNIFGMLYVRLRGRSCRPFNSDQRVLVPATGMRAYPDVSALCGPPQFNGGNESSLINPQVIVEVLSPSTERYDRGAKFAHYRRLESLTDYLLVSQEQMLVEHFTRQETGGWNLREFAAPGARVPLAPLGCELPLEEIYESLVLSPSLGMALTGTSSPTLQEDDLAASG